jgi:hypothetical protein
LEYYTQVLKTPSWMAWAQRPSGQIKMEGSASAFKGRECFVDANIDNSSKSSLDSNLFQQCLNCSSNLLL